MDLHFSWVKRMIIRGTNLPTSWRRRRPVHNNNLKITYNRYPKSAVTSEVKCLGLLKWQSEWDNTNKGALTKAFPKIKDRLAKRLQMNLNLLTVVTGQGKLGAYLYRFKIVEDPTCP